MRVLLDWQISDRFGWGVYGLNLALEWSRDATIEASSTFNVDIAELGIDALRKRALYPFASRSGWRRPKATTIAALGNEGCGLTEESRARVAVIFFEQPLSRAAVERLRRYELIITGSTWNERMLRAGGLTNVRTILQGIDPTLFHPAPKRGLYPDRFLIFSGGKAEPRKGQDIVVKAFRAFASRHRDAMLVTAWHSPWPQLANGMDLDLSSVADQVIDVGAVPNNLMPPIMRECDIALFPNRAEGGTNLVAMEFLACGLPAMLSANTGHLDLASRGGAFLLPHRASTTHWSEWGEPDVDEIVEALELAYRVRWRAQSRYPMQDLTWSRTAHELTRAIRPFATTKDQAA